MIGLYGADGGAFYRNPAARRAAEWGDCRLPSRFVDPRDYEALVGSLAAAREARLVAEVRTSAGARWHEITAVSSADPATGARACLISEVDVTELKAVEARVTFAATHDELTGLPNRGAVPGPPRAGAGRWPGVDGGRGGGGCCSTSTTSRASTTASATRRATRCCAASPAGSAA